MVAAAGEVEQTARKIVKFQFVDVSKITLPGKKIKKRRHMRQSKCIVGSTHASPAQFKFLTFRIWTETILKNNLQQYVEEQKWLKGSDVKKANKMTPSLLLISPSFLIHGDVT
jgi:hypothetical protein